MTPKTSGILLDEDVGLSEDEFPITKSELGRIEESGLLFDGGVGAETLSEDEFEIIPDSEPARIEAGAGPEALANLSQELSEHDINFDLPDSDPWLSTLKSSKTMPSDPQPQSPHSSPSGPAPQPRTAFHIYAGAFPSQEAAMNNGFYTEGITITIVEDPRLAVASAVENADYWMVKSDGIPNAWMKNFRSSNPQAVKENTCWEWVRRLLSSSAAVANSRF